MNRISTVIRLTAVLALGLCISTASAREAEMVANPIYTAWAKLKVGSTVTYKVDIKQGQMTMLNEVTNTLVDIRPDGVTIESKISMQMNGQSQSLPNQKTDIPAQVVKGTEKLPPGVDGEAKDGANEAVEVNGKSYDCTVTEFTGEKQGQKSQGKIFRSDEIPGGIAKLTVTSEGGMGHGEMTMNVVGFEAK